MNRSLDFMLKTKLHDIREKIMVFSTNKTLNERFTINQPGSVFVLNNGFTASFKNNNVTGRVVFEYQRSVDTHKRFSSYGRCEPEEIKRQVIESEDKNQLNRKLRQIINNRRKVLKPSKLEDVPSIECCHSKEQDKPGASLSDYKISSSSADFNVNSPRSSRAPRRSKRKRIEDVQSMKNLKSFERVPIKRSRDGQAKGVAISNADDFEDSDDSEPIIYSPFNLHRNNHYFRQSLYKWRRKPLTKKQLDEELDRYMSEKKFKRPTPVADDVDTFVQEYMMETEKCLNQTDDTDFTADCFE